TERDFFFNSFVKDNAEDYYFVHDKVPHIEWKVEKETSKKILGFECTKATAVFRGSPITAYFTEEIPFSVGPFKFFGLPGAILDVRVDGKNYDLWKAVKVEIDNTTAVDYNPQFSNFTKANMKDYTNLRDEAINKHIDAGKVEGSTGKRVSGRMGVEKVFEWENE
ncbi:MAG: GLPGLI family protein, partial [Chryseobacterium sp.]|nr:GLPGLI family protein [Candidatus Chryseobacterium enterohippi]